MTNFARSLTTKFTKFLFEKLIGHRIGFSIFVTESTKIQENSVLVGDECSKPCACSEQSMVRVYTKKLFVE